MHVFLYNCSHAYFPIMQFLWSINCCASVMYSTMQSNCIVFCISYKRNGIHTKDNKQTMPRIRRRCMAPIADGIHKCKRQAGIQEHVCTQHLQLLPTCPCCLEIVIPHSERHVNPHCGHALHFDCAQKWTITCESKNIKTTCPTCRAPFSHCMRGLLDNKQMVRHTLAKLRNIRANSIEWKIESFEELMDLTVTVVEILHKTTTRPVVLPNMRFMLTTVQGRKWILPKNADPIEALANLTYEIENVYRTYQYYMEKSKTHEEFAKSLLRCGSTLKCTKF